MNSIINSILDNDLYKFTMAYAIQKCFPRAEVRYEFIDRNNTVYPEDFADLVEQQIFDMSYLKVTDEEIAFMKSKCYYLPEPFFTWLKGYEYDPSKIHVKQDEEGHLKLWFEGNWSELVLWEVPILAIISELSHIVNKDLVDLEDTNYEGYEAISFNKGLLYASHACTVAEFGTRRRMSFKAQKAAIKGLIRGYESQGAKFTGTSNVYFAMKYDLTPVGTFAHEWVAAIAGFFGPQQANYLAMKYWQEAYDGNLGIFLYDTFGFDAFARNFAVKYAKAFDGVRIDSGDNLEQFSKIIKLYRSKGIIDKKVIMFSNALNTEDVLELHDKTKGYCHDRYGVGTHLTCDSRQFGFEPSNIVIKVVKSRITESDIWNDTCKISEDKGKHTGNTECVEIFKKLLHI